MIYGLYYDESDEYPGFAVAGYAGAYDTWMHLDWKWRCLLKKWHLDYFKASECENLLEQFAQYRDNPSDVKSPLKPHEFDKVKEIKTDFVDAICKHSDDLQGYGAVVVVKDFQRIISEDASAKRLFMDKPYYICFQLCLVAAAMPAWAVNTKRHGDDRVLVRPYFDFHDEYSHLAPALFNKFRKKNKRSADVLLPPSYDDDRESSPLQVADNLAYEARKHLTRKITKGDDFMRTAMRRLRPFVYRIYKLDYDALKLIVARQKPDSIPISPVKVEELW